MKKSMRESLTNKQNKVG